MKKNDLLLHVLVMAQHGFAAGSREAPSKDLRKEFKVMVEKVTAALKDFRENGQFTKEDY